MLITVWSVKGGSGTTVVAASLAVLAAEGSEEAWLVDLAGDAPGALGMAEPASPGVSDWLAAPTPLGADALARLVIPVAPRLGLVPRGRHAAATPERWRALATALAAAPGVVVVDAGSHEPPAALREAAAHDVLVTRACYLALRRAAVLAEPPSEVVLLSEPGRALRRQDVEAISHAPVTAEVEWDPLVARALDAGLLSSRLPRALRSALGRFSWLPA